MANFWSPNIERKGRVTRAVCAVLLMVGGILLCFKNVWGGGIVILSGGFVLFEALRGWCVMRACGIKTRL